MSLIVQTQDALKLINDIEEPEKVRGLSQIEGILAKHDPQVIEYGYEKVILNELLKLAKFEPLTTLHKTIELLLSHYGSQTRHQDEIMESLLFRYGMSTDYEICRECVLGISRMTDMMQDNIGKHSKQIMQAADVNNLIGLNDLFVAILQKLKQKLPTRRTE